MDKKSKQLLTKVLIIVWAVVTILYDIHIYKTGGYHATISYVIKTWSIKFVFIPYTFGVLVSHFFSPNVVSFMKKKARNYLWIGVSVLMLIFSLVTINSNILHPFFALIIGMVVGLLWTQYPDKKGIK